MLDLYSIAKEFERGLNEQLVDPNLKFRIWVNAGERSKPIRTENTVIRFIDGILRPTASQNLGTLVDAGAWSLVLDFIIPIPPPKTAADGTESLERLETDQYNFVLKVFDGVNEYFSRAESMLFPNDPEDGVKQYSVGIRAGIALPGTVSIFPGVGEGTPMTVYIELNYMQSGVNSRAASVAIDTPDNLLPVLNAELSRSNVLSSDVYAGKSKRQSVASASAFALSLQLPLTKDTGQIYDFLAEGKLNVAHFVFYTIEGKQTIYWMIADEPAQAQKDVSNIGLNVNFIELVDDEEFVNLPDGYRKYSREVDSSAPGRLNLTANNDCYVHCGRNNVKLPAGKKVTLDLEESDFLYNEETGKYVVYLIVNPGTSIQSGWEK